MNGLEPVAPLDPQKLRSSASLNRVRIVDLPGVQLAESSIRGKTAFELLSGDAVAGLVRERARQLQIPEGTASAELPLLLDACFRSENQAILQAAEEIARIIGHRLGYLIAALKRGDAANRQARAEWDDTYWRHWAGIQRIALGGGLLSGQLGLHVVRYAQEAVEDAGVKECTLSMGANTPYLPLIGSARSAPPEAGTILVFDFGGSFIKRAIAHYRGSMLVELQILPRLASYGEKEGCDYPSRLASHMVSTIAETWQQAAQSGLIPAPHIIAAIASYVNGGQPESGQGGSYSELRHLSSNAEVWLSRAVSERLRQPVSLTLLHDGSAAARAYAGDDTEQTAVIALGTAIGIGFPPPSEGLRPVAPGLVVS